MANKFRKGIDLNGQRAVNAADASSATDLVTLQQMQAFVRGLDLKDAVRAATTGNISIAAPGSSIDGVTMSAGQRFLARAQTTGSENGIYVWNGAATPATRATDADSSAEVTQGMAVTVAEGTTKGTGGTQAAPVTWVLTTADPIVLGTTALVFSILGGAGTAYTADGNGIELSGFQFALELDGTSLSKSATGLRIGSGAAGAGLTEASGVLAVGVTAPLTVAADSIGIDTAVVARIFQQDCAATTNPQTFTHGLGKRPVVDIVTPANDERQFPDVTITTTTVVVDWGSAPTAGEYRVIAVG